MAIAPPRCRAVGGALGRPRVGARGLPPEARFATLGDGGWHVLDWTPPAEAEGTLEITLVAIDRREPRLTSERELRIDVRPAVPGAGSERAAPGRHDGSVAFGSPLESPPEPSEVRFLHRPVRARALD